MTTAPASEDVLPVIERLALYAGRKVMEVFDAGFAVARKSDASPVTAADRASERVILAGLRAAFPDIPCVAEEEVSEGMLPAGLGGTFFLVDPLDGTREFVAGNGDFTVNIGLVLEGRPAMGVVFAPFSRRLFSGRPGRAEAVLLDDGGEICGRRTIRARAGSGPPTIVASRSHMTPETDRFIRGLAAAEVVRVGSSLKFCLIASGEADLYPRFGRTMEWDTAAGDAVLRAAGGATTTLDGRPLAYGKRNQPGEADFANPFFIARGAPETGAPPG